MKSKNAIFLLSAVMLLSACGGEKEPTPSVTSSDTTSVVTSKSQAGSSKPAESSKAAGTTSVATTSKATSTSSKTSTSTTTTSSTPVVEATFAVSGIDLVSESDKALIKITGSMTNIAAAKQKMAFGLVHKKVDYVDEGTGGWVVGSETPAAKDYKYEPVVAADGTFEVKIDVTAVKFGPGAYSVYAGPEGKYVDVTGALTGQTSGGDASGSQFGGTKVKSNGFKLYFRDDVKALIADELPPVELAEAFFEAGTGDDAGKTFVLIGGELGESEAAFKAHTPFVQFQNTGNWRNVRLDNQEGKVELVVRGTKGYVKADISGLTAGNWNTHLNIKATTQADCKMETNLDTRATPFINGTGSYAVYSNTAGSQQAEFWGNLGLIIGHVHNIVANGDKVAQMQPIRCSGTENDVVGFDIRTDDMLKGQVPDLNNNNTRLGKGTEKSDIWDITGVTAGEYEIHLFSAGKDAGTLDSHWDGRIDVEAGQPAANHGGDKAGYRYTFRSGVGEKGDFIEPTTKKTMRETGMTMANTGKYGITESLGTIMISEDDTRFEVKNMDNGYASFVGGVRLIRVGAYKGPVKALNFVDGKARIEAEKYTGTSNRAVFAIGEDANASGGKYLTGFDQYGEEAYYDFKLTEAVKVKFIVRYSCHKDDNGYGADEFSVDGVETDTATRGVKNAEATADAPIWASAEVAAQELAAGNHQFKLRVPWGASSNFDYIEMVKVTE